LIIKLFNYVLYIVSLTFTPSSELYSWSNVGNQCIILDTAQVQCQIYLGYVYNNGLKMSETQDL